jgi:hypothetical protein
VNDRDAASKPRSEEPKPSLKDWKLGAAGGSHALLKAALELERDPSCKRTDEEGKGEGEGEGGGGGRGERVE